MYLVQTINVYVQIAFHLHGYSAKKSFLPASNLVWELDAILLLVACVPNVSVMVAVPELNICTHMHKR